MIRGITSPKDVHILNPGPYDYVILFGKTDSVEVIELCILMWENYPGLCEWAQYYHRGHDKKEEESEKGNGVRTMEAQVRMMENQRPRKAGSFWELEKTRKRILPESLHKEHSPINPFQIFDL